MSNLRIFLDPVCKILSTLIPSLLLQVEELTAEEVLAKLQEAWINEKNSPELLEPKMEVCTFFSSKFLFLNFANI